MSKSTTISVGAAMYARIEEHAEKLGIAVSSLVEQALARELGTVPPPARRFRRRKSRSNDGTR